MKLTIENYHNLNGVRRERIQVEEVSEMDGFYVFECRNIKDGLIYQIPLCREAEGELNGKPVFYFRDGSHRTQGVTADTLKDTGDVLSILEEELQTLLIYSK